MRACAVKLRLFLPYLLNCWSFCKQTWFNGTSSLFCEKIRLMWSRSRSQPKFQTSLNTLFSVHKHSGFFATKLGVLIYSYSITRGFCHTRGQTLLWSGIFWPKQFMIKVYEVLHCCQCRVYVYWHTHWSVQGDKSGVFWGGGGGGGSVCNVMQTSKTATIVCNWPAFK